MSRNWAPSHYFPTHSPPIAPPPNIAASAPPSQPPAALTSLLLNQAKASPIKPFLATDEANHSPVVWEKFSRRYLVMFYFFKFFYSREAIAAIIGDIVIFYHSKRSIEILQVCFSRKQVWSWLEFWLLSVPAFTSVFDSWLLFPNIGL